MCGAPGHFLPRISVLGTGGSRTRQADGRIIGQKVIRNIRHRTAIYYIPVGFETLTQMNDQWDVNYKLEGIIVIGGSVDYKTFRISQARSLYLMFSDNSHPSVYLRKAVSDIKGGWDSGHH